MLPIILVSEKQTDTDSYLDAYITEHATSSFDVFTIEPEKKDLGIDEIRELKKLIVMGTPRTRLIIIKRFDTATLEAQNALLKTLEEKTDNNQFILTVISQEFILPTIRSRSRIVTLGKEATLSEKNIYIALFDTIVKDEKYSFLGDPLLQGVTKESAMEILDAAIIYFRKHLSASSNVPAVIKKALQMKQLLRSNNLNPQLSIDSYLIFLKKQLHKKSS